MEHDTRLFTIYTRAEPYLYGAISVVGAEAAAQGGTIPLEWSYPYVISRQLEDREIVFGSSAHGRSDSSLNRTSRCGKSSGKS